MVRCEQLRFHLEFSTQIKLYQFRSALYTAFSTERNNAELSNVTFVRWRLRRHMTLYSLSATNSRIFRTWFYFIPNIHRQVPKMSAILDKLLKFINYWWFRYLMVTELYIVEKWERVVMRMYLYTAAIGTLNSDD